MTPSPITIFRARRILTMNPARPEATHVAVRDGRILGAGPLEELAGWGAYALDDTFADKVLMPGFVEGHSHAAEGTFWRYTYLGRFDRMDPEGKVSPGAESIEDVVARLQEAERIYRAVLAADPIHGVEWFKDVPSPLLPTRACFDAVLRDASRIRFHKHAVLGLHVRRQCVEGCPLPGIHAVWVHTSAGGKPPWIVQRIWFMV